MHAVVRIGLAGLIAASLFTPAAAEDFRNYRPWDYKARRSPVAMARATTMWQVEQADRAGGAQSAATAGTAASGGAPGAVSNTTSIGNMNVITVAVGQGGVADVAVETEQSNLGRIDGRSVAATGASVGIGSIR